MSQPFTPTFKWHCKVLAALLLVCVAAYLAMVYITRHLPPPYQHHTPPSEITPWLK